MTQVAKYNTCKGVSTALTVGTPLVTLACCGDFFVHRSDTAISAAGIFAIIILMMVFKDKIAEKWKTPSVFVLCTAILILLLMVEKIILPVKYVCIATMASTGIDELTFTRIYKRVEIALPEAAAQFKHVGFIMSKQTTIDALSNNGVTK